MRKATQSTCNPSFWSYMSSSVKIQKPKCFDFVRGLCILMACLGLLGSLLLLIFLLTPSFKEIFNDSAVTLWKMILGLVESIVLLIASIRLINLKEAGRKLIIIICLINIIEYVYNSAADFTSISLTSIDLVSLVPFAFGILALMYFSQGSVKAYLRSR